MRRKSRHSFHVPVMGIGFTVDTPLRIARFGIDSVISLVDDELLEQMRRYYAGRYDMPFTPIERGDEDWRARRVKEYLDLVDELVRRSVRELKESPLEEGSPLYRYYRLLPECEEKRLFEEYLGLSAAAGRGNETEPAARARLKELEDTLRNAAVPGSVDVNIMTKLDREVYVGGKKLPGEYSEALAALRGFVESGLESAVVLSAGLNRRLYGYISEFDDFFPVDGPPRKQVVLKVSDFRSAQIQGKFLASRGVWVSEYRIESGLNCGGHAFPTKGLLMGPILERFKLRRDGLIESLFNIYRKALAKKGLGIPDEPLPVRITVQGGVVTHEEHRFLMERYGVDSVGWGTPCMLVEEISNVDDEHVLKLLEAGEDDVYLSNSSPLGVPFWNLRSSSSEMARRRRIEEGCPGSVCVKGHARLNEEYEGQPLCVASREYVKRKLEEIAEAADLSPARKEALIEEVLSKSCICTDLSGSVLLKKGIESGVTPAVCCGPSIVYFRRSFTLEELVDHIYGRGSLLSSDDVPPHVFLRELSLYIDFLKSEVMKMSRGMAGHGMEYLVEFKQGLEEGISYYRTLFDECMAQLGEGFNELLDKLEQELAGVECTA